MAFARATSLRHPWVRWTALGLAAASAFTAMSACQLVLPSDSGSTGTGGKGATSSSSTGGVCDEAKVFTTPASMTCAGSPQCSGFCDAFDKTCGTGFNAFKQSCCAGCASIVQNTKGDPLCCREGLLAKVPAQATCSDVVLGDGTMSCGGSQQTNFCALASHACGDIKASDCQNAKPQLVVTCRDSLFLALASGSGCNALSNCISNL